MAICDRNVLGVLGVHIPTNKPTLDQKVAACLVGCDLIRAGGRDNQAALVTIQDELQQLGKYRPLGRIVDALLWVAY